VRVNLSSDEVKDLSRQLRFLYASQLRQAGFVDDEASHPAGIAHPTLWRFEAKFPELENYSIINHTESMDGETLIREAMTRVEQEENIIPRNMSERYVGKLRDAVRRMAVRQSVEWKRAVEAHATRFIPHQEPLHTYLAEKIVFKIWV